jgi:hypothetical protein
MATAARPDTSVARRCGSDDHSGMQSRRALALLCSLTLAAGVTTVAVRADGDAGPRYPTVRVVATPSGYTVRWTNSTDVDYDPLTVHTVVYTKDGLIEASFLDPDIDHVPGCCSLRLVHRASATFELPRMSHPVGWIEFVDLFYGRPKSQTVLPRILCTFHPSGRSTCRRERQDR